MYGIFVMFCASYMCLIFYSLYFLISKTFDIGFFYKDAIQRAFTHLITLNTAFNRSIIITTAAEHLVIQVQGKIHNFTVNRDHINNHDADTVCVTAVVGTYLGKLK